MKSAKQSLFMTACAQGSLLLLAFACSQGSSAEPPVKIGAPDGAEMVLVPAGPFLMGSLDGDPDERPLRQVTLSRVLHRQV
jgi:formylglycine-generating enzyme required for sulfatase activity